MNLVKELKVSLDFGDQVVSVGRLAERDNIIYFEYDAKFLQKGMQISPFRLPLQSGVIELPSQPFEGLAGVFNDSLPDGWGRLLFDRMLKSKGITPASISPLDRLASVGLRGLGALIYEPDYNIDGSDELIDLDILASQTKEVLEGDSDEVITELLKLNGSSAGARPKALIGLDTDKKNIFYGSTKSDKNIEQWLVKFPNSQDGSDGGAIEYIYALMAKKAGVHMPEVHLFPSKKGKGYFAVKRFDKIGEKRNHMHTASGLLHSDFRVPTMDYSDLLKLTAALTKDIREVQKMFRLAVFNVMAHNRDDHGKNFSFLMNNMGQWQFSPAYDITFSNGPGGEQSTMVLGEGKNFKAKHFFQLGEEASLSEFFIKEVIDQTKSAMSNWKKLATKFKISDLNKKFIGSKLKSSVNQF